MNYQKHWVAVSFFVMNAAFGAEVASGRDSDLARAANLAHEGVNAQQRGSFLESERMLREALAVRTRVLGANHFLTAQSQNDLGAALYYQSKFTEAEALYKQALAIFTIESGHLADRAGTLSNLASLYREQRKLSQSEDVYALEFELFSVPNAITELAKAVVLNDYGTLQKLKGNPAAARKAFEECLAIRERKLPGGHPQILTAWTSLADLYYTQREFARAEELFRKATAVCETSSEKDGKVCASTYNGLGLTLGVRGMRDEANRYFERALVIFQRSFGTDHPRVAAVLNNIGTLADSHDDLKRAERYMQRALDMWIKLFGPEHPDVASAESNLASVQLKRKQFDKAESLYRRALAVDEKVFGSTHDKVAVDLNNLAALYARMKRYEEAEQCFDRAAAVYEKLPAQYEIGYAALMANRAAMSMNRGMLEEAAPLYRRAIEIYERNPTNQTPRMAAAFDSYADLMRRLKEPAEAEKAELSAMRIRVQNTLTTQRLHSSFAGGK